MSLQPLSQHVEDDNVYRKFSTGAGNGTFAKCDLDSQSQILSIARPLCIALDVPRLNHTCYACFRDQADLENSDDADQVLNLKTCGGCKVARFCNKRCQKEAWSQYHRLECKVFSRLHPRILPTKSRAAIRLLLQHKTGILPPGEWDLLLSLEGHQEELCQAGGKVWEEVLLLTQAAKSYSETDQSIDTVRQIFCILMLNSFALTTPYGDAMGVVMDPRAALFNHSCDPNAFIRFDVPPCQNRSAFPKYGSISIHTSRPLPRDTEITVSYIDQSSPFQRRQRELKERYFFTCSCNLCKRGPDSLGDRLLGALAPSVEKVAASAERLLIDIQTNRTSQGETSDKVRHAMKQLAQTKIWPLHQYPWPGLRNSLLQDLLADQIYEEALVQAAISIRMVQPARYGRSFRMQHFSELMLLWTIARQLLEAHQLSGKPMDSSQPQAMTLGILCNILIDDCWAEIQETRKRGRLEALVNEKYLRCKSEGLWKLYKDNEPGLREQIWTWVDVQIKEALAREGVADEVLAATQKCLQKPLEKG